MFRRSMTRNGLMLFGILVLLAGGGFQGGQVIGETDERGEKVKERPVYPCDLITSKNERLGIDPAARLPHPTGKAVRVAPSPDDGVPMAGRLTEIM